MPNNETSASGGIGWRNLRTGLLFIAGIVIAGILGLIIGKNTGVLTLHDSVYLFVSEIRGLAEGNMVAISGKKIGVVKSMDFAYRNDSSGVAITLEVSHEYFALITKDSKAIIRALGVLGDKYVDISLGHSSEHINEYDYLSVVAEPGFEELTASALKTMRTFQDISGRINSGEGTIGKLLVSNDLHDKLLLTAANLQELSSSIKNGGGLAGRLIYDKHMADQTSNLITSLSDVSDSLRRGKGTLGRLLMDDAVYTSLNSAIHHADSLFTQLNNPNSSIGRLSRDTTFYQNLNSSIKSLDSLMVDIKRNPGRYVKLSLF